MTNLLLFDFSPIESKTNLIIFYRTLIFEQTLVVALDAGCGPGRTALELCSVFGRVEAYDYSQGFVDMMINEMSQRELGNLAAFQV